MQPGIKPGDQPQYDLMDEYTFQKLCCEILQMEPGVTSAVEYGVRGQRQYGVDLLAFREDGGTEVGQCKRYKEFSASNIVAASDEFFKYLGHWKERRVRRFVLFVAGALDRTQELEEVLRQRDRFRTEGIAYEVLTNVQITNRLRPHPGIVAHYFDGTEYWVERICGSTHPKSQGSSRALMFVSDVLGTQIERLAERLSTDVESHLEEIRQVWREGRRTEALTQIQELRSDHTTWSVLPAELKGRVLRLHASMHLVNRDGIDHAEALLREAGGFGPSAEESRLRALIIREQTGTDAALATLGNLADADSLNLKVGLLLEAHRHSECKAILEQLSSEQQVNVESLRLRSLYNLVSHNIDQARADIQEAIRVQPLWFNTRLAGAVIDYYSALSPAALPDVLPAYPEPVSWSLVRRSKDSLQSLIAAAETFRALASEADLDSDERLRLSVWLLACLANDDRSQEQAKQECARILEQDPRNPFVIAWANSRAWDVDLAPTEEALVRLFKENRASAPEVLALVSCYLRRGASAEAREVLERSQGVFGTEELQLLRTFWLYQTALVAEDLSAATECVSGLSGSHFEAFARSGVLRLQARKTGNWRPLGDHLEQVWKETQSPFWLFECCEAKARVEDWQFIADRANDLVEIVNTPESASLSALSAYNTGRFDVCMGFLDKCVGYFRDSKLPSRLKRLRVTCQEKLGILPQAVAAAQELAREEPSAKNLLSLAQVLFAHGDLRGVAAVARQIDRTAEPGPEVCLRLARLVQWDDHKLSVSLWQKAAGSAELQDDQVGEAVSLGFQLGLDDRLGPLIQRMAALGETHAAGIEQRSISDMVDFLKQRQESTARISDAYAAGAIPIHLAVRPLNLSLVMVYHQVLEMSEQGLCSLASPDLLTVHGARGRLSISRHPADLRLNIDISSFILAVHLNLLDLITETFGAVRISAHLVPALVAMRDRVAPHQPARIRAYRQVLDLLKCRKLAVVKPSPVEGDDPLESQLGGDWAGLFCFARERGGYLVDFLPLRKADLSGAKADISEEDSAFVIDCRAVAESLRLYGPISEQEYVRIIRVLGNAGREQGTQVVPKQGNVLVLHFTVAETLAEAGLLAKACERFDIYVEARETERLEAELRSYEMQRDLVTWTGAVLDTVRDGIADRRFELFMASTDPKHDRPERDDLDCPELDCLFDILSFPLQGNDVLLVDDRCISAYKFREGASIIGVADILELLRSLDKLSDAEYYALLLRLRASKVRFMPLYAEEIVHHLQRARVEGSQLVETDELRVLRRYVASLLIGHTQSAIQTPKGEDEPGEVPYLLALHTEIADAIASLWKETESTEAERAARADWALVNLYCDYLTLTPGRRNKRLENVPYLVGLSLASLVSSAWVLGTGLFPEESHARRGYFEWLEDRVLSHRFRNDPPLLSVVVEHLKELLSGDYPDDKDENCQGNDGQARRFFVQQLYDDLPNPIKEELARDARFCEELGLTLVAAVSVNEMEFEQRDFIEAVGEAVNGRVGHATALGEPPFEAEFRLCDDAHDPFVVMISANTRHALVRDEAFGVLRDSVEDRQAALLHHRSWFDCSQEQLHRLVSEISALPERSRRFLDVEQWRNRSVEERLRRLAERVQKRGPVALTDLDIPTPDGACWHLGIPPFVGSFEEFHEAYGHATRMLLQQKGILAVAARFWGLPIAFPSEIVEAARGLPCQEKRLLVKGLLRTTVSPVSKLHLVHLLLRLEEPKYIRLALKILAWLLGPKGEGQIQAFAAVLQWAGRQSAQWNLPACARLSVVWAHASMVFSTLVSAQVQISWVERAFQHWGRSLSVEEFRREPDYWNDVANPRWLSRPGLILSGISYALGECAGSCGSSKLGELVASVALLRDGELELPVPALLRSQENQHNLLGSFLRGHDAGARALVGDRAELLTTEGKQTILRLTADLLEVDRISPVAWGIVHAMYLCGVPAAGDTPRVSRIVQITDFVAMAKDDAVCARLALIASALVAKGTGEDKLQYHLVDQLVQVARACSDGTVAVNGSEEEFAHTFLQCALELSINQGALPSTLHGFAEIIRQVINVWPTAVEVLKPAVFAFLRLLPVDVQDSLLEVLLLGRAT